MHLSSKEQPRTCDIEPTQDMHLLGAALEPTQEPTQDMHLQRTNPKPTQDMQLLGAALVVSRC
jgi:hypothetical protein